MEPYLGPYPVESEARAAAPAHPTSSSGELAQRPTRRRHTHARDVALLVAWLFVLFLGTTLLVWRLAVARFPALPTPTHPTRLVVELVVATLGGALLAGIIALYPNAGLFLLAATAPLEQVLYVSIGSFRVKPYEAILLGLVAALLVRRRLHVDRLTGVLLAYVLFGLVSLALDLGAPIMASVQVIGFEVLMALLFMATRASVQGSAWGDAPPWLERIASEVGWLLAPIQARVVEPISVKVGWFWASLSERFSGHSAALEPLADVGAPTDGVTRVLASARRLTIFYVLVVGNGVTLYGLGQFVGYYLGLPIPYFHPEVYAIFRPYATFIEPNPFGTFLTAQLALAVTLLISPAFRRWRAPLLATLALQLAVLALNLSRGAWLAAGMMLCVLAVIRFRRRSDLWRLGARLAIGGVALAAVGGVVAALIPAVLHAILTRLGSFTNLNGGTLHWRTTDFLLALQAWSLKPIVGYGPGTWGAAAYGFVGPSSLTSPRNIFTAWLFERGLVGALLAIGFYKLIVERAIRAYWAAPNGEYQTLILAYGMAMLAVFIGFFSASAEIVPYYWFQLGVLAALSDVILSRSKTESAHANWT